MTAQLDLDYVAFTHARAADPSTSREAAVRAKRFATTHADMVLDALRARGGLTPHELAAVLPLDSVQITRRLNDLKTAGHAEPNGHTRPTPSGARARVWAAKQ